MLKYFKSFESFKNIYRFNYLSESDLFDIAKKGLETDYSLSGAFDETDDIYEASKLIVEDFKQFLSIDYPIGLGNIPNNPIIYRILMLESENSLNYENLGNSWFSNIDIIVGSDFFQMLDHIKKPIIGNKKRYLIKAYTDINNIDVYNTLWQRSTQFYENEIVLINTDSKYINILEIKHF